MPGENRHAAWEARDWQQQAACWPDPFPQHALGPDETLADLCAWVEHMERVAAIIRGTEISQAGT